MITECSVRLTRQSTGQFLCPDDPAEHKRESVTLEEADVLAMLARGLHVVEIGTGLGIATHAMARTARSIYTVDPDPWVAASITLPANVSLYAASADVPTIPRAEFFFVDGAHDLAAVLADIAFVFSRADKGALVVFHDRAQPGVSRAIDAQNWAARYTFVYSEARVVV